MTNEISTPPGRERAPRGTLSRERILEAAMQLADRVGVDAVSMRRVGDAVGVEAMSLYNHVANKDALLDGMIDVVFGEIALPPEGPWRPALRERYVSTRQVLARHRWAIALMESRTFPGPATMRAHDSVLRCLRQGGFPLPQAAAAYSLLDSYTYGFALTERALPFESPEQTAELTEAMLAQFPADEYPYLAEIATQHVARPGYDYGDEYERGLDLILDSLERLRTAGG